MKADISDASVQGVTLSQSGAIPIYTCDDCGEAFASAPGRLLIDTLRHRRSHP